MKTRKAAFLLASLLTGFIAAGAVAVDAFDAGAARSGPASGKPAACRFERAAGMPSWFIAGAEVKGRYLVVDINNRRLVEISRNGVASELRSALAEYVAGKDIRSIRQGARAGGAAAPIVIQFAGSKLLEVDGSLTPRGRTEITTADLRSRPERAVAAVADQKDRNASRQIARLLNWIVTGDGKEVVGYADLALGDNFQNAPPTAWRNGFVRFELDNPKSFLILDEGLFPGDQRTMMQLTYPLMASLGSTAYVINQEGNHLDLRRIDPDDSTLHPMSAFPDHLKGGELAPMLPSFITQEEYVRTMEAAEVATMPVGLYAWKDALFILSRSYRHGQRQWFLSKIDPKGEGTLLWTVPVPVPAQVSTLHMMAISGETEWMFLDKGKVLGGQNQVTHHAFFVSSDRLERSRLASLCN